MLRTLQNRLILSHLLPLLIIIPLTGIAFIYVLENQVVLPSRVDELISEGDLIAEFSSKQPELWQDREELHDLMMRIDVQTDTRVMIFNTDGTLMVATEPTTESGLSQILGEEEINQLLSGETIHNIKFSQGLQQNVINVFTPVFNNQGALMGIVRLSHSYTTIYDELVQMRMIIIGILAIGLIAGISLGSLLAVTISTPVRQVTDAIDNLARGNRLEHLDQQGPEEIQSLMNSTNTLFTRLHDLESARQQLLANLVHEIGRPLGALRSGILSLKLGAGKDPQLLEELTSGMDAETARLQHLLDELAHMHDQIFGTLELNRQTIDTRTWLPIVLRPWEEAALNNGLNWTLDIPDELPEIKADPFRLAQAIENLVSNAIKYTPRKGDVTISARFEQKTLTITIKDSGPGISPEEQDKIFAPFYRGDQKTRIKQGMGLGLSIARDVVLAHGGEITLDSQAGAGSSFTIWIPAS